MKHQMFLQLLEAGEYFAALHIIIATVQALHHVSVKFLLMDADQSIKPEILTLRDWVHVAMHPGVEVGSINNGYQLIFVHMVIGHKLI